MAKFKPVKKTTFLEAVAAAIQHEKEVFDFYLRNADKLAEGKVKQLFYQLAEDVDDHIQMIQNMYTQVEGGKVFPNLKLLSEVHKFHTTSLQILMRRLDRNTGADAGGDELEAVSLAMREHKDTEAFYQKMAARFEDPNIRNLFGRLANFQEECMLLMESYAAYQMQGSAPSQPGAYWEEEHE